MSSLHNVAKSSSRTTEGKRPEVDHANTPEQLRFTTRELAVRTCEFDINSTAVGELEAGFAALQNSSVGTRSDQNTIKRKIHSATIFPAA